MNENVERILELLSKNKDEIIDEKEEEDDIFAGPFVDITPVGTTKSDMNDMLKEIEKAEKAEK